MRFKSFVIFFILNRKYLTIKDKDYTMTEKMMKLKKVMQLILFITLILAWQLARFLTSNLIDSGNRILLNIFIVLIIVTVLNVIIYAFIYPKELDDILQIM